MSADQWHFILYGRAQCHLCDEMVEDLQNALPGRSCQIEYRDVDTDPTWQQRYGTVIPVLTTADGQELARVRLKSEDMDLIIEPSRQSY